MQLVCCLQLSLFLSLILKRILNSIVMDVMDMEPYLCEQSNVFCMSCFVFRSPFKIISLQKENIWYFIKSCFFLNVFFFFGCFFSIWKCGPAFHNGLQRLKAMGQIPLTPKSPSKGYPKGCCQMPSAIWFLPPFVSFLL